MEQRLKEITERAEKASIAPWVWDYQLDDQDKQPILMANDNNKVMDFGDATTYYPTEGDCPNDDDADFIAHARQDIPYLLAQLAALEQANKGLREALTRVVEMSDSELLNAGRNQLAILATPEGNK